MFAIRTLVKNPDVITQKVEPGQQEVSFTTASQPGDFYLVHPATTKEILFIANVDLPDTAAQDSASKSNNPAVSG